MKKSHIIPFLAIGLLFFAPILGFGLYDNSDFNSQSKSDYLLLPYKDALSEIDAIDEKYEIPLSIDLEIGDITAVVKLILDKYKPGIVLWQSNRFVLLFNLPEAAHLYFLVLRS